MGAIFYHCSHIARVLRIISTRSSLGAGFGNASCLVSPEFSSWFKIPRGHIFQYRFSMTPTSSLPSARVFKLLMSACVKQRGPLCITTNFPTSAQDLPPQELIALDSATSQSVLWNRSLLQSEVVQSLAVCFCRSYNHWAVECFASPQSCAQAVPVYDVLKFPSIRAKPVPLYHPLTSSSQSMSFPCAENCSRLLQLRLTYSGR